MVIFWSYLHALGLSHRDLFHISKIDAVIDSIASEYERDPISIINKVLQQLPGTPKKKAKILTASLQESFAEYSKKLQKLDVRIYLYSDDNFPEELRTIPSPIFLLYVRGTLELSRLRIAVVGSRQATPYGEQIVTSFLPKLVQANISIVSGGALGIDGLAHETTLRAKWHTIVVLGSGVDVPYPRTHIHLFDTIVEHGGAVISHFPLGFPAAPYTFPQRNEIIAGLVRGLIVVEAKERSGSLITAQLALEMGKDVFAIPSDISRKNSLGTNRLIQNASAKLLISPDDILEEYGLTPEPAHVVFSGSGSVLERNILTILDGTTLTIDALSEMLRVRVEEIQIELGKMEIFGTITRNSLGQYTLHHG